MKATLKPAKEKNLRMNFYGTEKGKSSYENIITKDPNRLAQILMDLVVLGFPVDKAIQKYKERIRKKDWFS